MSDQTHATGQIEVRVAAKIVEAEDICSFELMGTSQEPLPGFSAGSHIDVYLPNGITRQYSLCNEPHENHRYLIAVLKDPNSRGGSNAMHEEINVGDYLKVSVPKNHFHLAHGSSPALLFAGGIGITPILCMAERLAVLGEEFKLHYSSRSPSRMAFLERIKQSKFASQVAFHFDDGDAAQKLDICGVLRAAPKNAHVYVCGPKGFMDAVLTQARSQNWSEDRLHYEFFAAEVVNLDSDGPFDIQISSSGRVVRVEADQTVVQALEQVGIAVSTSCEQGICGTCITRVLKGEPDHRDMFLTAAEQACNDQFLPCCSRSKTPLLVLDL